MATKVLVTNYSPTTATSSAINFEAGFIDTSTNLAIESFNSYLEFGVDLINYTTQELFSALESKILARATVLGVTVTTADIIYGPPGMFKKSDMTALSNAVLPKSFNYTPGRSIVTGTGATGFQVSSTREAVVTYSAKITTTATIAGGQEGYVVLEIAPTNSATAGDWKEVGRVTNGQALSLALTLQSIQPVSGILMGLVPAGYYVKVRSVNTTGTPTYSMVSGQEIMI